MTRDQIIAWIAVAVAFLAVAGLVFLAKKYLDATLERDRARTELAAVRLRLGKVRWVLKTHGINEAKAIAAADAAVEADAPSEPLDDDEWELSTALLQEALGAEGGDPR